MNQAKKLALERYPKKLEVVREPDYFAPKGYPGTEYIHEVDVNFKQRNAFVEGYEAAQKDLGWISVKERLPEKEGWYLTCSDDNGTPQAIGVTRFDGKGWEDDDDSYYFHVDYWMPIPELPKEK